MPIVTGKTPEGLIKHAQKAFNEKWWYVWGTFGNKLTESLLETKAKQYPLYNGGANKEIHKKHLGQTACDCVGLIKGYCMWSDKENKPIYRADLDYNTGMMYDAATRKGTIDTIPERAGICVYMQGHVGVYIGNGWVIECAGNRGAVKTPLRGKGATAWTHWMECPFIDYSKIEEEVDDMAKYLPYTVEVKTFSKAHDLAEGLCSKLADKGYYAFVYSVKEIDRVCVGRFDTEKKAQITCGDLKKKGFAGTVKTV